MSSKGDSDKSSIYSVAADDFKPNYDNYVVCPYDKTHILMPMRLACHLIKCSRNHPGNNMVRCPFNNTHIVRSSELNAHITNCSNYKDFMRFKTKDTLPSHSPTAGTFDLIECSENWNDEPDAETYNPQVHCAQHFLIKNFVGGTAAQRRKLRENQRKKFREFSQGKEL